MATQSHEADTDDDSVSLTSTAAEAYASDQEFEVERILAETERGPKRYLILWAEYPEERSTWEPKRHIQDPAILEIWGDDKMRQESGLMEPFDVKAWNTKLERLARETAERHRRRRDKRKRLGLAVSSREDLQAFDNSESSDKAIGVDEVLKDDSPRRHSSMSQPMVKTRVNPSEATIFAEDNESDSIPLLSKSDPLSKTSLKSTPKTSAGPLKSKKSNQTISGSKAGKAPILDQDSESDKMPPSWGANKEQPKPSQAMGSGDSAARPRSSSSSVDLPLVQAHRERLQSLATASSEQQPEGLMDTASTRASASKNISQPEPRRGRGRLPGRRALSTRELAATRGDSALASKNVFTAGEARKKRPTLIENVINPSIQPKHFKNLHQVRKAQLAGREVADAAPDMSAIPGGLFDPTQPMAYKGLKPALLRKPSFTTKANAPDVEIEAVNMSTPPTSIQSQAECGPGSERDTEPFVVSGSQVKSIAEVPLEPRDDVPWQLQQPNDFLKQVCYYLHETGRCTKRDGECKFLHTYDGAQGVAPPPPGYDMSRRSTNNQQSFSELVRPDSHSPRVPEASRIDACETQASRLSPWQQPSVNPLHKICYYWHKDGSCTKGGACRFLHTDTPGIPVAYPPGGRNKTASSELDRDLIATNHISNYPEAEVTDSRPVSQPPNLVDNNPAHQANIADNRPICRFWEGSICRYSAVECHSKHAYDEWRSQISGPAGQPSIVSRQAPEPATAEKSRAKLLRPKSVSFAIDDSLPLVEEPESFNDSRDARSDARQGIPAQAHPSNPVCLHWLRGDCHHGATCWNRHEYARRPEPLARPEISAQNIMFSPSNGVSHIESVGVQRVPPSPSVPVNVINNTENQEAESCSSPVLRDNGGDLTSKSNRNSMDKHKKQNAFKSFGDRGKEVIFGASSSQHMVVDFGDLGQVVHHPWGQAFARISKIRFDRMCIAQDVHLQRLQIFKQVLRHDSIAVDDEALKAIEKVVGQLRLRSAGLVSVFPDFVVLVYPAQNEEWRFLEVMTNLPKESGLRYLIYNTELDMKLKAYPITPELSKVQWLDADNIRKTLAKVVHNLSFSQIVPRKKADSIPHIYLLFPSTAHATADFLISWLRACRADCKIYTSQTEGSWNHFTSTPTIDAATVLIHESALSIISRLPSLTKLLRSQKTINFWLIADSGSPYPTFPSSSPFNAKLGALSCARLFPHGQVFLLTPSFLVAEPDRTFEILSWFLVHKLKQATPGTWKLACCRNLSEYLLDLAIHKADERDAFNVEHANNPAKDAMAAKRGLSWESCQNRFLTHSLLIELFAASFSDNSVSDVDEVESPFIFAPNYVDRDDEKALVTWFAEWAMSKLDIYRKFTVVGTTPASDERACRMKLASSVASKRKSRRYSSPRLPQPETERSTRPTTGMALRSVDSSEEVTDLSVTEHKKKALSVAAKLTAAGCIETHRPSTTSSNVSTMPPPNSVPSEASTTIAAPSRNEVESTTPRHGISAGLPELELHFIAATGSNVDQARRYLSKANNSLDGAIALYWKQGGTTMNIDTPASASTSRLSWINPATTASQVAQHEFPSLDSRNSTEFELQPSGSRSHSRSSNSDGRSKSRSGIFTEDDGTHYVPSFTRPSGSERPEKCARPVSIPKEDMEVYNVRKRRKSESREGNEDEIQTGKADEEGGAVKNEIHFEATTVWYKRLVEEKGEAWEHVLVEGWEDAFKALRGGVKNFG